ncbi:helix-turn-helix domain-containing protein [Legionella cherrii]|nr:helix-turn-helix domain-containing protein [Legionella cherrii]
MQIVLPVSEKKHSTQSICKMFGVGKTTLYKYINQP